MASREETVLRAEASCSRSGAPQSQLQFLADWRELSVTAPVRSHSMFTVMELLAWNSLLRVGAYRSPNGPWMTAFSINQTLTSTGRMTFHGRFLSIALQHPGVLPQGPPERREPVE